MKSRLIPVLVFVCLILSPAVAAPSPSPSASASATATPSPSPIALPDVIPAMADVADTLRGMSATLTDDPTLTTLHDQLPSLIQTIDQRLAELRRTAAGGASLDGLHALAAEWQQTDTQLNQWARQLTTLATLLQGNLNQLDDMRAKWDETLQSSHDEGAPTQLLTEIGETLNNITHTRAQVKKALALAVTQQNAVSEQQARVKDARDEIDRLRALSVGRLWERDSPPLWNMPVGNDLMGSIIASLNTQVRSVTQYTLANGQGFLVLLLLFSVLLLALSLARRWLHHFPVDDEAIRPARLILDTPVATAMVGAIMLAMRFFPRPPQLLLAILVGMALFPTIRILRRLVSPSLVILLDALVVFYVLERVRDLLQAVPFASRLLFLVEMALACGFLLLFRRRVESVPEERSRLWRVISVSSHAAFILFVFAGCASVIGNVNLAVLIGRTVFRAANLAIILYTALDVLDAGLVLAARMPPLATLNIVERHHESIRRRLRHFFAGLAIVLWIAFVLDQLSLRELVGSSLHEIFVRRLNFGAISVTLGDIVAFGVTVWLSFAVSSFIRFVMEEDVFPRVHLGRGVPYAISTLVNYCVLLIGFFLALAALGVDMSRFAVLAGAFGVGIGFGLQTIVNNFVSGLILLFERPVKVGDSIQIGDVKGTVQYIGIRASIVRTWDLADVVVPNGSLLSERVSNWTFSSTRKGVEINVEVDPRVPPAQVLSLLEEAVRSVDDVLTDPAPSVYVETFTERGCRFRVRGWTARADRADRMRSRITVAIDEKLREAGIALAFKP